MLKTGWYGCGSRPVLFTSDADVLISLLNLSDAFDLLFKLAHVFMSPFDRI